MFKKKFIVISSIVLILFSLLLTFFIFNRTDLNFAKQGTAIFKYSNTDISQQLSDEDFKKIITIFDNKFLYKDEPSCGFDENVSIVFNDSQTFCIACDKCPVIYWKEKNKYFRISEDKMNQLYSILKNYGFVFPCV